MALGMCPPRCGCSSGRAVPVALPVAVLGSCPCIPRFSAGDVVMIQPQNQPEDVQLFCQLLRLEPHRSFVLEPTEPGGCCPAAPSPSCSARASLSSRPAWSSALPLLGTWLGLLGAFTPALCLILGGSCAGPGSRGGLQQCQAPPGPGVLAAPAQSGEDPAASSAPGPGWESCASLRGACRSPHSACAPGTS